MRLGYELIIAALFFLSGCGDVNIEQSSNQEVTVEQLQACGGDCKDEQEECPDCFDEEYLEFSGLTFEDCLEESGSCGE